MNSNFTTEKLQVGGGGRKKSPVVLWSDSRREILVFSNCRDWNGIIWDCRCQNLVFPDFADRANVSATGATMRKLTATEEKINDIWGGGSLWRNEQFLNVDYQEKVCWLFFPSPTCNFLLVKLLFTMIDRYENWHADWLGCAKHIWSS